MQKGVEINNSFSLIYSDSAFSREDESNDHHFYSTVRMVSHLDSLALSTVQRIIGALVVEPRPVILDLMASWDSHLPANLEAAEVLGLGLNRSELDGNSRLDRQVVHDLNHDPRLPLANESVDVVLNTVSVDYLTRPFEVFREVGRVLRPGGLFLVTFSNRMFPAKAVRIWRDTAEDKRPYLVQDFFDATGLFDKTSIFVQKGQPRPSTDKYAGDLRNSDPIYAVYANRRGGHRPRASLNEALVLPSGVERDGIEARKREVHATLRCPYCEQRLLKWRMPLTPFTEWGSEFMFMCFNDGCPYLVRGWSVMADQGNLSFSYRFMFDADRNVLLSIPVHTLAQLREGIVEER